MEKHPIYLKNPELQTSPEVEHAVERQEDRAKSKNISLREDGQEGPLLREKIPNDPGERIKAYMDRLENIFLNKDERVRGRNIEMLRDKIYEAFIVKRENVPESYFELQKKIARERGQNVEEIPSEMRERMIDVIIEDQKASLDSWINYLISDDAMYPTWYKYFVFRNITRLSQFDKELGKFKTRTESTTAPFPDIYREPLAQIADVYLKVAEDNKNLKDPEIKKAFSKKFPTLYAEFIQESLAASIENKEEVKGEWIKYEKGNMTEAEKLFESLEGKGTGWCTAGRSTAETQVESGDFYVYYTYDKDENPTQPRIAIRMEEDRIAEVRGILPHQALEPQMNNVLEEKLAEFGSEADSYKKKSHDMKLLTEIEKKTESGEELIKEDLIFLYEIEHQIEGFGYERDPRIAELQSKRDPKEDAPIVLDCLAEEIAWKAEDINKNTKAYIGELFPGVFKSGIENIYTSFPEGRIHRYESVIGGKTKDELKTELENKKVYISDWASELLESKDFTVLKNLEDIDLVRITVEGLGFPNGATTDEIYKRAEEFGLELCPAEVGPHLRLTYSGVDWMYIAMKQITVRDGYPDIFDLYRDADKLRLRAYSARPSSGWGADRRFVFRIRKS